MSYATPTELKTLGLPADALEEVTDPDIQAQLDADAGIMDMYIGARYSLPISAPYPEALKRINVCLTVYHIMMRRGFNPEGPDALYKENYLECMGMLGEIRDGRLPLPDIVDSTPTVDEGTVGVSTKALRGWGSVGSCSNSATIFCCEDEW